jgi:hypothetical protein
MASSTLQKDSTRPLADRMMCPLRRNDIRKIRPATPKALVDILVVVRNEKVSGMLRQIIDITL